LVEEVLLLWRRAIGCVERGGVFARPIESGSYRCAHSKTASDDWNMLNTLAARAERRVLPSVSESFYRRLEDWEDGMEKFFVVFPAADGAGVEGLADSFVRWRTDGFGF